MGHQLDVFDTKPKKIGSLVILIGNSVDTLLWQWQGKGGSKFGLWEWRYSGSYRMVLSPMFSGGTWGTLWADWKSLPNPQSFPQQPWFSKVGIKEGDISIYTASSYYNGTWKLI